MATAITPLANVTLSSNALSVTFSSISGAYRDLYLIFTTTYTGSATAEGPSWRVNGDTGSNYNRVQMYGNGSSTGSNSGSNEIKGYDIYESTTTPVITQMHFMDYSATDKHKTVLIRSNDAGNRLNAAADRWASTSAITSITIYAPDSGGGTADYWTAGGTFMLYGVSS